jgi:hypothetical protein
MMSQCFRTIPRPIGIDSEYAKPRSGGWAQTDRVGRNSLGPQSEQYVHRKSPRISEIHREHRKMPWRCNEAETIAGKIKQTRGSAPVTTMERQNQEDVDSSLPGTVT